MKQQFTIKFRLVLHRISVSACRTPRPSGLLGTFCRRWCDDDTPLIKGDQGVSSNMQPSVFVFRVRFQFREDPQEEFPTTETTVVGLCVIHYISLSLTRMNYFKCPNSSIKLTTVWIFLRGEGRRGRLCRGRWEWPGWFFMLVSPLPNRFLTDEEQTGLVEALNWTRTHFHRSHGKEGANKRLTVDHSVGGLK